MDRAEVIVIEDSDAEEGGNQEANVMHGVTATSFLGESFIQVECLASLKGAINFFRGNQGRASAPIYLNLMQRYTSRWQLTEQQLQGLADAIAATKLHILTVSLDLALLNPIGSDATIQSFYRAIGKSKGLTIRPSGIRSHPRIMQKLTRLLPFMGNLTSFACRRIVFQGEEQDFVDFAAAIQAHLNLKNITFSTCLLAERNKTANCINPVLTALQAAPDLSELKFGCWVPPLASQEVSINEDSRPLNFSLAQVCRLPSLKSLHLAGSLGNGQCCALAFEAIQENKGIERLSLMVGMAENECTLLSQVVRNNSKCLRSLTLSVSVRANGNGQATDDQHIIKVFQALESNTHLRTVSLHCGFGRHKYVPSTETQKAILSLLETKNQTLKDFELWPRTTMRDAVGSDFFTTMNYYLKLNRLGRKDLLGNANAFPSQWINTLSKASDCPSALFYFLSKNPALCDISSRKRKLPSTIHAAAPRTKRRRFDRNRLG